MLLIIALRPVLCNAGLFIFSIEKVIKATMNELDSVIMSFSGIGAIDGAVILGEIGY